MVARQRAVPAVVIIVTATRTRPRGFSATAICRVMVIGRPSAAIAASRVTPEVTLENTPTVVAEYRCAVSVQKTKPRADVATVLAKRNREPRYKVSSRTVLRSPRNGVGRVIPTVTGSVG